MTTATADKSTANTGLKGKDYATDQEVRWCPGCGDYSILKQVQTIMAANGMRKEDVVFVSGIGCAARFPYYMDTYGIHSVHGRAPAVATGLKITNPNLSVWIATGDGDSLSIGGNHFIHTLRRNVDLNMLMFNNEIYGLTKGQYSPTSEAGKVTKSTPAGSLDHPINPAAITLGADGTFMARTMDRDPKHLQAMLNRAYGHKGTSMLEIYQNCNVFNDGAFFTFTDKATKSQATVFLEHDKPLLFGEQQEKGIHFNGGSPKVVDLNEDNVGTDELWVHDETDQTKANMLARIFDDPLQEGHLPRPFGVFYAVERGTYEDAMDQQLQAAYDNQGAGNLDELLQGEHTWTVE